jgi:hypothetical protein
MAGYPGSGNPPTPTPPPQSLLNEYNIAKAKEQIAKACYEAVVSETKKAKARIEGTKKKINSYRISGGKVFLQIASGIQTASFNKDHYIEGINVAGVRGRIDNDFSFVTGSTTEVKYDTDLATLGLQYPTDAYVYSVDSTKSSGRKKLAADEWESALGQFARKFGTRKLTYEDLPRWNSNLNPQGNGGNAPVSPEDGWGARDDVYWYETLHEYEKYCLWFYKQKIAETKTKKTELDKATGNGGTDTSKVTPDGGKGGGKGGGGGGGSDNSSGNMVGVGDDKKPVIHNFPAVKEVYFTANNLANFKVDKGNLPAIVFAAEKLWEDSSPYKGMIQSYIVPSRLKSNGTWWRPDDAGVTGLGGDNKTRRINTRRYGFQFQYNPSTVSMNYAGAPQVDIGLQTSGADKVPLIGSSVTSSTVTFSIIVNRMHDFKYLDALIYGQGTLPVKEIYSHVGNHPVNTANAGTAAEVTSISEELKLIKELGTMYDIEYLLRTLLGYQLKSNLRGKFTSDIGYLGAYPVELHLGKNLRYLGIIDGFSVSHTIFNQNMVPVFSNVQITFSRLPDFAKKISEVVKRVPPEAGTEEKKS